jgi:hypothetical protein
MDPNNQSTGTNGSAGTAAAPQRDKVIVSKNDDGLVDIRVGATPPGYTALTNREEILDALTVFNRAELTEKIADLCGI